MLNGKKRTKTKPKAKPTLVFKKCSYVCAYHCAQLSYTAGSHRYVTFRNKIRVLYMYIMLSKKAVRVRNAYVKCN